jgi:hypothetical protein
MAEAKSTKYPTHVAVHNIVTNDASGKSVDLPAGTRFTPKDRAEAAYLEKCGAASKIDAEEAASEPVDLSAVAK